MVSSADDSTRGWSPVRARPRPSSGSVSLPLLLLLLLLLLLPLLPQPPTRNHTTPASSPTASTSGSAAVGAHASAVRRHASPSLLLGPGTTTVCSSQTTSGVPGIVRRTYTKRSAVRAVAKRPATSMYDAMTVPVRPLPARQCTTATFCGSLRSQSCMCSRMRTSSPSGGGWWSGKPHQLFTRLPKRV